MLEKKKNELVLDQMSFVYVCVMEIEGHWD